MCIMLANLINTIADSKLQGMSLLALSRMLQCPLSHIDKILVTYGIILPGVVDSFIPPLGDYVPERYFPQLSQDVFSFWPEQIVALEIDDPMELGEDGQQVFLLAKVVERVESECGESEISAEYRITVGDAEQTVDASRLYAFLIGSNDSTVTMNARSLVLFEGAKKEDKRSSRISPTARK